MTMQKVEKLRKEIEEMTGRNVKIRGTEYSNKPAVFIDINGMLYRCVFLGELYWALSDVYWIINSLKYGKNSVDF